MRNVSKLGVLCLSLFAAASAMQPLHAAKPLAPAAKDSGFTKEAEQRKDREFCARYLAPTSRIVRQSCRTEADWERSGIELLVQK